MSSNHLNEGRHADSDRRRQRVTKALNNAGSNGNEISVAAIARAAGVNRTFLYRHPDLLAQVHAAAAEPPTSSRTGPTVSRASLQADLAHAHERTARQATRIRQLESKLSEMLGEQAYRDSGIGAPDDIDQLNRRITSLEQHVAELTGQLDERNQELDAARAANRELMSQINTPHRIV